MAKRKGQGNIEIVTGAEGGMKAEGIERELMCWLGHDSEYRVEHLIADTKCPKLDATRHRQGDDFAVVQIWFLSKSVP